MMIQVSKRQWIDPEAVELIEADVCGQTPDGDLYAVWATLRGGRRVQVEAELSAEDVESACWWWAAIAGGGEMRERR